MYPLLHNEDIVYLKKIRFSSIKTDDIVCFKKYGKLQTHRIIYRTNKYLITKGDNNLKADGKVYPRQIIGRVYQVKRNGEIFNPEDIYLYQSTLYFQEIIKVKKAFENAKINFVFLKGLPIHFYYEKTHPRRLYADCDILVKSKDLSKLNTAYNDLGYEKSISSFTKIHKTLRDHESQISYKKIINNNTVKFDIHFDSNVAIPQLGYLEALYPSRLIHQFNNELLDEKVFVNIQNIQFPLLSLENQILFSSFNLFRDGYKGTYRYHLLMLLFNRLGSNNYRLLANKIIKYKMENYVYPSILLLIKYFKFHPSTYFLSMIKPKNIYMNYINKIILNINIFDTDTRVTSGVNRFKQYFYLSPNSLIKRSTVFLQPKVLYSTLWVAFKRPYTLYYRIGRIFFHS